MAKSASRRKSREHAFKVLYGLNFSPAPDREALARAFLNSPKAAEDPPAQGSGTPTDGEKDACAQDSPLEGFAWELVEGVWRHAPEIDAVIDRHAHKWRSDRLGKIELALLRIAVYELLWLRDAPPRAVLNEALELTGKFGEAGAKPLVNGILDAVMKSGAAKDGANS